MNETAKTAEDPGYSAVRDGGAGFIDLSTRGRVSLSGSDAKLFLNGLVTNDMNTLAPNSWMPAVFPTVQGRLLAAVRILNRGGDYLIDTERATRETVFKLLERFTLAGDFRVADLTSQTSSLALQGEGAGKIMDTLFGAESAALERGRVTKVSLPSGNEATVIRATHTAEEGFDLFIDNNDAPSLSEMFLNAGAQTVSGEVLEILRIEAGIPRFGIDMDQTNVVTETSLDDHISFTKGCYVGQEILIRIKHRGHVAKKLVGVMMESAFFNISENNEIISDDHELIGHITSSTFSPRLERPIALAYLKYDYLEDGTRVWIDHGENESVAEVSELPMVRGSWYKSSGSPSTEPSD